jgi:hypothetical protein
MEQVFSVAALAAALDTVTAEIKREVGQLVIGAANVAHSRIKSAFPVGPTGNLRRMVTVTQPDHNSSGMPVMRVRATAPHVWIWENGTRQRRDNTRGNANRGASPAHGKVFEAISAQARSRMLMAAQELVMRRREL